MQRVFGLRSCPWLGRNMPQGLQRLLVLFGRRIRIRLHGGRDERCGGFNPALIREHACSGSIRIGAEPLAVWRGRAKRSFAFEQGATTRAPLQSAVELSCRHRRCEVSTDRFGEIAPDGGDGSRIETRRRVDAGWAGGRSVGRKLSSVGDRGLFVLPAGVWRERRGKRNAPMRRRRERRFSVSGGSRAVVHRRRRRYVSGGGLWQRGRR